MTKKVKRACWILIFLISASIAAELALRFMVGLGNPPLFEPSDLYGYRLIPNQDIRRFGNRIFYNAQGLRSEPITLKPSAGIIRILCIGDSITYGGSIMDQEETYPYQLEKILNSEGSRRFEILNASAPGWSIGDEEGYISAHGIYNSRIVVLQTSKDDLFQQKCDKNVVGNSPNFPARKPVLALQELFVKYFPRALYAMKPGRSVVERLIKKGTIRQIEQLNSNLRSLAKIKNYVSAMGSKLIVVFIGSQMDDVYDESFVESGKKLLFKTIDMLDAGFINLDEKFSLAEGGTLLRDKIHPNPDGNKVIAEALAEHILDKEWGTRHKDTRMPKYDVIDWP